MAGDEIIITSKDGDVELETTSDECLGIFTITAYNVSHEIDYPSDKKIAAKGLEKEYNENFLKDVIMQGTGIDKEGKYITIDWLKGKTSTPTDTNFKYTDGVRGAANRNLVDGTSIAVDPTIISLGTWIRIDGIGKRRADDTGGTIKGKHIDVFNGCITTGCNKIRNTEKKCL